MSPDSPLFDPQINTEYMPSQRVPDAASYWEAWGPRSAAVRAEYPPQELSYGTGPRERLDVFEPTGTARATLLFIHGGYWVAFDKEDFSYVAPPLLGAGVRVAVVSYDLAPAVSLRQMVRQVRQAASFVSQRFGPLLVAGHSAGGHLAAMTHCTDWAAEGLPAPQLVGGIGISGLYDLGPLRHTEVQADLQLSAAEARALSPVHHAPSTGAPFVAALGELESAAFYWQADQLAAAWRGVASAPLPLPQRHHFDAPEDLLGLTLPLLP